MNLKVLRVAAAVEAVTVVILFVNLFTVHARPITSLGGPTHGTAYLVTIVATFSLTVAGAAGAGRARAFVPGIGGMLALGWLRRHPEAVKAPAGDPAG